MLNYFDQKTKRKMFDDFLKSIKVLRTRVFGGVQYSSHTPTTETGPGVPDIIHLVLL